MNKLIALTTAATLAAGSALACNPWISPTDTGCAGLVVGVTTTAPVWNPQTLTVTPTNVVTGTIAINSAGAACVLSATTWVKLTSPATACNFSPASGL